jgi:hypothetical protein
MTMATGKKGTEDENCFSVLMMLLIERQADDNHCHLSGGAGIR